MHHIRPLENPEYVSVTEWKFCQYLTTPHRKKMLKRQIYNSQYMHYLKLSLLYSTKKNIYLLEVQKIHLVYLPSDLY